MVWAKVDDRLHSSVKWRTASKGARALWTTALSWCADQETDGHVPAGMLPVLDGTVAEARSLVSAGLWEPVDGGWRFRNWAEYQPVRADLERRRAEDAERKRKAREAKAAQGIRRESAKSPGGHVAESVRSPLYPVPSRPDPTQIDDGDTSKPVTEVDVRAGETDQDFITREADMLGIGSLPRVRAAFARAGVDGSDAELVDLARAVLALSLDHVGSPEAYIETACVNSPAVVVDLWSRVARPGVPA